MGRNTTARLAISLLLTSCTGLFAPDGHDATPPTHGIPEPAATPVTAAATDEPRTTIDLLDGSVLEVVGAPELELTGYSFTIEVPGIRSRVQLSPDVDPTDEAAVDQAAVLESDLGSGVRLWRADRAGQPIIMTVDLGGWVAFLHVGNDTPPDTEFLLSIAEDTRGEVSENGVVLPGDLAVDVFTIYLRDRGTENQVHLGMGDCHREIVPGSEVVEHTRRGEMVRRPGYASWCDPANDLEVLVYGEDDFVGRTVQALGLTRSPR